MIYQIKIGIYDTIKYKENKDDYLQNKILNDYEEIKREYPDWDMENSNYRKK
jgi:hypothetical protein